MSNDFFISFYYYKTLLFCKKECYINPAPGSGFEYEDTLFPWEGNGKLTSKTASEGKHSAELQKGNSIYQYVYLDHSTNYELSFKAKESGKLRAKIDNIAMVTGKAENTFEETVNLDSGFNDYKLSFSTDAEYGNHMRTVKVSFVNEGTEPLFLDDIRIIKE